MSATTSLPLLHLLRSRRELPLAEAHRLLGHLPAVLDAAPRESFLLPLVNQLYAVFYPAIPRRSEKITTMPVTEWPPFRVQFGPGDGDEDEAGMSTLPPRIGRNVPPVSHLAMLWYEVLGGRIRGEELLAGRFAALAGLSEQGNDLLRAALGAQPPPSCTAFYEDWTERLSLPPVPSEPVVPAAPPKPEPPAASQFSIPEALLEVAERGEVLDLVPQTTGGQAVVPIRLVARGVFRIGRSRRQSDLPTTCLNTAGVESDQFAELSRVHTTLELTAAGLSLRDGNGERPSANGSNWLGRSLSPTQPTPLVKEGMLLLSPDGARYQLAVTLVPPNPLAQLEIENLRAWAGRAHAEPGRAAFSAVHFDPPPGRPSARQAVWLLTVAEFRVLPSGGLEWVQPGEGALAVVYRYGGFWLLCLKPEAQASVDGTPLEPRQIAPLRAGSVVLLGDVAYELSAA